VQAIHLNGSQSDTHNRRIYIHCDKDSKPFRTRNGDSKSVTLSRRDYILEHTRLRPAPAVPELQLYLAEEIIPLWSSLDMEPGGEGTPPPFWAFAWAGGQALARYLLDRPHEVLGKRVLDFAAGSGICAIAAMKAGACEGTTVDIDPFSAEVIALNAVANGVRLTVRQCDLLQDEPPDIDLVIAGDVCYEELMAVRVLPWLRRVQAHGIRILIGDPGRAYFPMSDVMRLAEYDVPTSLDLEDSELKRTGVYTFR
jgi:predicted nicotinamide N-methyase